MLSGQVAVDLDGNVIGETIEEQTRGGAGNCRRQLAAAGCGFADVFKVNVYLDRPRRMVGSSTRSTRRMPAPLPVRTAVQAVLLPGFRVEIEMWAVKPNEA